MNNLEKLLDNIPDLRMRKSLESIIKAKVSKRVKCMSPQCNGRIIGHIHEDGSVHEIVDPSGGIFLRASRHRLDGYMGFQCWCGNDSRLAKQEKGNAGIENNAVQRSDLEEIWDKVQREPSSYPEYAGKQRIDNFLIEKL